VAEWDEGGDNKGTDKKGTAFAGRSETGIARHGKSTDDTKSKPLDAHQDNRTATMRTLQGKRAFITGAGLGLGRALAWQLARAGAEVIVTDRDQGRIEFVVGELRGAGLPAHGYHLDVTSSCEAGHVRERVLAERGPIDVLINNAGVVQGGPFVDVPLEKHRQTFEVNVLGLVAVTHAFLPDLLARPEAHIVNIASASAFIPLPWGTTYAASKWAVLGFTDSLREELRLQGRSHLGVTAVCPSYIDTGLFTGARPPRFTWLLTADDVASAVVHAIRRGKETILLPWTARLLLTTRGLLPQPVFRAMCRWMGVSTSMMEWTGRN
jgi:all-trans-retinol dehydrogenase (NAD+)